MTHIAVVVLLGACPLSVEAQHDKWQRVYTGEEFIVDVNPATLTFQPGRVLRLQLRTVFSKPESIIGNSKYKTRVETIEFKSDKRYRYHETILLDSAGKTVLNSATNPSQDWKIFKPNGITSRLFDTAISLPPLGRWMIIGYRYADGSLNHASEPGELARLTGTMVTLDFDAAAIGTERCSSISYESHALVDDAFYRKLGISINSLGVNATQGDAVIVKCDSRDWAPPQSLILPSQTGNLLMLWKGVFVELKRQR